MKVIVVNDIHKSARVPISRKANYNECIQRKLNEIAAFTRENDIGLSLFTGDFFHSKKPNLVPYWLVGELAHVLHNMRGTKLAALGNHDWDEVPENIAHYPIAYACMAGGVKIRLQSGLLYDYNDVQVAVINSDKGRSAESIWKVVDSCWRQNAKHKILLVHGPIIPKFAEARYPTPFLDKAVKAQNLIGVADYVFYGDIHDSHGVYTLGEGYSPTVFCNFGSLSRNTAKELERKRPVSIAYLDLDDGKVNFAALEDVEPAESVFRTTEIVEEKEHQEKMEQFIESIGETNFTVLTPDSVRNTIRESPQLNDEEKTVGLTVLDSIARE